MPNAEANSQGWYVICDENKEAMLYNMIAVLMYVCTNTRVDVSVCNPGN